MVFKSNLDLLVCRRNTPYRTHSLRSAVNHQAKHPVWDIWLISSTERFSFSFSSSGCERDEGQWSVMMSSCTRETDAPVSSQHVLSPPSSWSSGLSGADLNSALSPSFYQQAFISVSLSGSSIELWAVQRLQTDTPSCLKLTVCLMLASRYNLSQSHSPFQNQPGTEMLFWAKETEVECCCFQLKFIWSI